MNPIQNEEEEDSDTVVISDHEGEEDNSVLNDEEALQDCYE